MKMALLVTIFLLAGLAGCNFPRPAASAARPRLAPTATPQPAIDPLTMAAQYLSDVRIVGYDPLDSMNNWTIHGTSGSLVDGVFELPGTPRWQSSIWPSRQFREGQGLTIRFKVQESNARSEFVFVTGGWLTDTFRQFGVYNAVTPKGDLFQGTLNLGGYDLAGNLAIHSDTWYTVLLAVGRNGHFEAVLWDPANSTQRVVYDLVGGPNWAGKSWVFLPKVNTGETVYVADFFRLSFGDIR